MGRVGSVPRGSRPAPRHCAAAGWLPWSWRWRWPEPAGPTQRAFLARPGPHRGPRLGVNSGEIVCMCMYVC